MHNPKRLLLGSAAGLSAVATAVLALTFSEFAKREFAHAPAWADGKIAEEWRSGLYGSCRKTDHSEKATLDGNVLADALWGPNPLRRNTGANRSLPQ